MESLRDCIFLVEDRGHGGRMMRMVWLSLLIHLFIFSTGILIAPYVRTIPEPQMPPLLSEQAEPAAELPRAGGHGFESQVYDRYGMPPVMGRNKIALPVLKREGDKRKYGFFSTQIVIPEAWSLDRRLAWLGGGITGILAWLDELLDRVLGLFWFRE